MMFYHLKIAIRNLRRESLYSAINISGLAVSLAVCILIFLWVRDELSFNRVFRNADRIYQIDNSSPKSLAPLVAQKIPEVQYVCRIYNRFDLGVLSYNDEKLTIPEACLVDSSFFSVFSFEIIQGNPQKPFKDKHSLVLTESAARHIFKNEEAVGKLVKSDTYGTLHVTAVIADMPQNSSIQYKAILPFSFLPEVNPDTGTRETDWSNWYFTTYAMVAEDIDIHALNDKINRVVWAETSPDEAYNPDGWLQFSMLPVTTMHLYQSDGTPTGMKNVRLFSIAALVLLLIAAINYVNLVTARIVKRTKEAGLRKILGSGKIGLFMQMMQESCIIFVLAMMLATVLIFLLLPFYNELIGKQLRFDILSSSIWLLYLALFISVILLAAVYPAVMLSSFKPAGLIDSHSSVSGKSFFRKVLVVTQFVFSTGLIVMTTVLGAQLNYMRTKNPGYTSENILYVRMHHIASHYSTVKNELLQQSAISGITATKLPINNAGWGLSGDRLCKDGVRQFIVYAIWGDYNILDFFDISFIKGNKFTSEDNQFNGIVVNNKLAEQLGWDDVLGKSIPLFSSEKMIVGEVKDFNFQSLHHEIGPTAVFYLLENLDYLYVKTAPGRTAEALATMENIWNRYNDGYPFEYRFLDEEFGRVYQADIRTGKLFSAFALIAILISCLGLFGLVTYTAEAKTREIGIRKVLGASVTGIVKMLSKEFLILVGIAMLIAFPLAYYWLDKMLQDYAYRINISWWMFALVAIITLTLTLLTVSWKAIKAATANPAKAIKSE